MHEVDALFKEYDTLRQESLDSMQNRTQIVAFGLATLAVLAGAVLSLDPVDRSAQLIVAVFCIGLPVISALVLYIWLGEVERMMRAGKHIQQLELRINGIFNTTVLTWETRLRSTRSLQMKYSYAVVIALFAGSALAAPWVGLAAGALGCSTRLARWMWRVGAHFGQVAILSIGSTGREMWSRRNG